MTYENMPVRSHGIDTSVLSGESYFQTLAGEALRCGYLSPEGMDRLRDGLMTCLGERIAYYTRENSSSVKSEAAAQLMDGIMYTVGIALKSSPTVELAAASLESTSVSALYEKGKRQIKVKYNAASHVYSMVKKTMLNTKCRAYTDTLNDGIESFFKKYSIELEPQESIITLDYPLAKVIDDLVGIELIQKYLESVFYENRFISLFPRENVESLLYRLNPGYKDCIFNIYSEVYIMARRCIAAGVDVKSLAYDGDEADFLSPVPAEIGPQKIISELNISNSALAEYIKNTNPSVSTAYIRY